MNVLNQIIQQRLLKNELQSLKLQVSDERLVKELNKFPEIQALKKSDGSIDADKYRQLLQSNGLSIAQFQNIKRSERTKFRFTKCHSTESTNYSFK
jgi:peptidyl-prolyl cis-trans isomerase D